MITQKNKIDLIPNDEILVIPVSQKDEGEDRLVLNYSRTERHIHRQERRRFRGQARRQPSNTT